MTTTEIRNKVFAELDSRNLANPSIRKNALDRVLDFIKISKYHENGSVFSRTINGSSSKIMRLIKVKI